MRRRREAVCCKGSDGSSSVRRNPRLERLRETRRPTVQRLQLLHTAFRRFSSGGQSAPLKPGRTQFDSEGRHSGDVAGAQERLASDPRSVRFRHPPSAGQAQLAGRRFGKPEMVSSILTTSYASPDGSASGLRSRKKEFNSPARYCAPANGWKLGYEPGRWKVRFFPGVLASREGSHAALLKLRYWVRLPSEALRTVQMTSQVS